MSEIVPLVLGVSLLFFGRKLFWLLVGGAGFLLGWMLVERLLGPRPQSVELVIGLAVGLVAAVAAIFLQKLAVVVAGFVVGGVAVSVILESSGLLSGVAHWLAVLGGAVLGAVLTLALFHAALIVLSSAAGAILILRATALVGGLALIAFVLLMAVGLTAQTWMWRGSRESRV